MLRKEFERCLPEEAGVSSGAVLELIEKLEQDYTEIHSLMIMRFDRIIAEGWWSPYAPGLRHMMMSASKTFAGTAIGIAVREGIMSLNERVADILPEFVPEVPDPAVKKILVRHLLAMASGAKVEVPVDRAWPESYFKGEFYEPGTAFKYDNAPATLLAQIIRKRTGLSLPEYLKPRLFDKIGIDGDNITWFNAPNGTNFAPGGLHCTTEDLLRLMRLYLRGGVWDGERILDEEFVKLATSKRIDSSNIFGYAKRDRFSDNVFGYGYMMWMSHDDMGYRAEGAYGQFGIVIPKLDMIIAITQTSSESPVSQTTLDQVWEFTETIKNDTLPPDPENSRKLEDRLSRLAVKRDPLGVLGIIPCQGKKWYPERGVRPAVLFYDPIRMSDPADAMTHMTEFSFEQKTGRIEMTALINGHEYLFSIPADGTRMHHKLPEMMYAEDVLLSAYWESPKDLVVCFRWIETCFTKELVFTFEDEQCIVTDRMVHGSDPDLQGPIRCKGGR